MRCRFFAIAGFLTKNEVRKVRKILDPEEKREEMVSRNYEIAKKHYSYEFLRRRLNFRLTNFFGTDL